MEKQELIENIKDQDVLTKALQNGHTDERHENKSLTALLDRILSDNNISGSSGFFPNVDKNALIGDAIKNNADKILEWLETSLEGARLTISFNTSESGDTRTTDGYIGNGFKRDKKGFVEPRKTDTMFLLLESNNENVKLGFNIITAFPDLRENFEIDSTIDPLKVLKETESYQDASIIGKLFYEIGLDENMFKNHDALINYELDTIEDNRSENSIDSEENNECIYVNYRVENEEGYLHGGVSKDGITVARKDENDNHIDWIMGEADKKYILLDNNKAIQKFKSYCPRMYELLDDIKGKLDARLEIENNRKEDTRTEKEHQALEESTPPKPSGGGGLDDR